MCDKLVSSAMERVDHNLRIYDQMASMHFRLSDKYRNWTVIENIIEIVLSVVLCGCTFLDINKHLVLKRLFGDIDQSLIMGISSIALFAFTLTKQALNHHQRCEQHRSAGKMYSQAKLELRLKKNEWTVNCVEDDIINDYLKQRSLTLNDLPQIPEDKFAKYKHWHVRKIEMSKFVDRHKAAPWCWCQFLFFLKGIGIYKEQEDKQKSKTPKLSNS